MREGEYKNKAQRNRGTEGLRILKMLHKLIGEVK